ncbi:hypothetical protein HKX48_009182 [Thoreauomyces humboldtii]|nr:hypothetical protein HKX48_009182 [Thoreauomyces humboldtii]
MPSNLTAPAPKVSHPPSTGTSTSTSTSTNPSTSTSPSSIPSGDGSNSSTDGTTTTQLNITIITPTNNDPYAPVNSSDSSASTSNANTFTSVGDATSPATSIIDPTTYFLPAINPTLGGNIALNPQSIALQTFADVQLSNVNSCLFGALTGFGVVILWQAWAAYSKRRKPIYLLNGLQASFLFVKTLSATIYAITLSGTVNCLARSPLMNFPMVFAWYLIWGIMLIKLMLFTEWKKLCLVIIPLGAAVHFGVVTAGIVMRNSSVTALGLCKDTYPILFKHQYDIEMILEIFSTGVLLQGITSKKQGVFAGTKEVFRQLQFNEHTRVFFAIIFVGLKLLFTYGNFNVPTATTHAVDSCRSAVVSWALTREINSTRPRAPAQPDPMISVSDAKQAFKRSPSSRRHEGSGTGKLPKIMKTNVTTGRQRSRRDVEIDSDGDDMGGGGESGSFDDIPGFDFAGGRDGGEIGSKDTVAGGSSGELV